MQDVLLNRGCGLGGAARFAADRYNVRVAGIDLTPEYIETGNTLCRWADLHNKVDLKQGSALSLPWDDNSFDDGYMLHVGMNIEEKEELFSEISRVLVSGATFGVYDIMRMSDDEPAYPVPWASDIRTSHLETPDQYRAALTGAGFSVSSEKNRREFALDFFKALKGKMKAEGGPPPLGLHTLMQSTTPLKVQYMIECISAGIAAPVEIISRKI